MPDDGETDRDRMIAAAQRIRATLESTRSDRLLRLFDYLLEKSLNDESASEHQVAVEVLRDDRSIEGGSDANVRVYIHRLRKVMEAALVGTDEPKLYIPVGEYRIRMVRQGDTEFLTQGSADNVPKLGRWRILRTRTFALIAVSLAIAGIAWAWSNLGRAPIAETPVWQTIVKSERPIAMVVGDYYLFAQLDQASATKDRPPQLVHDRSVPTREELIILQMLDPGEANSVVDYNQQFVSGGTIEALSVVRIGFSQLPSLARRRISLVAASQLTPESLASSDVIYVGQFSGMPQLLREPLAQASGFTFDPGFGGLTDAKAATRYKSDGMTLTDDRISRRDFAYLADMPGPAGNRILIIAGIGDAGVKEAAQIAMNPDEMNRFGRGSSRLTNGFEALYRVRTIKDVNVGATLVVDRRLRSGGIWDNAGNVPVYRPIKDESGAGTQQ